MNRKESDNPVKVTCYGIDETPFHPTVAHPDETGEFCFPPIASLITSAARLMLALLEHSVTRFGGTYAMEDTDSMAIVSTERGGLVVCPGGSFRTKDGRTAIRALSWRQIRTISERFAALNPLTSTMLTCRAPFSKSNDDDNFDPKTANQRQVYCFANFGKALCALAYGMPMGIPVLLGKGNK